MTPTQKKQALLHELYHLRNNIKILDIIACDCTTLEDIEATGDTVVGILKAYIDRWKEINHDKTKTDLP